MASTDMDWLTSPKKQFGEAVAALMAPSDESATSAAGDRLTALMAPSDESSVPGVLMSEEFANPIKLEVASRGDEMVTDIARVFLLQTDDRYIPYNLQVKGDYIVFSSQNSKTKLYHLLSETHIHSLDDSLNKIADKRRKFSGA